MLDALFANRDNPKHAVGREGIHRLCKLELGIFKLLTRLIPGHLCDSFFHSSECQTFLGAS
jgi:hypothetical protein